MVFSKEFFRKKNLKMRRWDKCRLRHSVQNKQVEGLQTPTPVGKDFFSWTVFFFFSLLFLSLSLSLYCWVFEMCFFFRGVLKFFSIADSSTGYLPSTGFGSRARLCVVAIFFSCEAMTKKNCWLGAEGYAIFFPLFNSLLSSCDFNERVEIKK